MTSMLNLTPFAAAVYPHVDDEGRRCRLLVVKGVWSVGRVDRLADTPGSLGLREIPHAVRMENLALESTQRLALGDRLAQEIEWIPSDAIPPKPRFDLIITGYACAPEDRPAHRFAVSVEYSRRFTGLILNAPRFWRKTLLKGGGAIPGEYLAPVRSVPLHPCFAYGGESGSGEMLYNPQGMGSCANSGVDLNIESVPLPWIEHPEHLISHINSRPMPGAFGPWAENSGSRLPFMGTRDLKWQRERAPKRPEDFDPRFYNQADSRLQWTSAPAPGEAIVLHGFTHEGVQRLIWPSVRPIARVGHQTDFRLDADTCVVAPQEGRYAIVWRHILPPDGGITLRALNA